MAFHAENPGFQHDPLVLILPDRPAAERPRWQERWSQQRDDAHVLELGDWDDPHRNTWVNKLNLAIYRAGRPVVLVAQGLGCVAAAWWAEYERPGFGNPVTSALLIAPPDLDRPGLDPRLSRFGSCPRKPLPFPSFLVGSGDCPESSARRLARDWGCRYVDPREGRPSEAEHGRWSFGEALLRRLLGENGSVRRYASPRGVAVPPAKPLGIA